MPNIKVKFLNQEFPNPTVLASGILGMSASSMVNVVNNGAGGVTTKSTNIEGRDGHSNPKVITYEAGMLNCYGLTNAGFKHEKDEIAEYKIRKPKNPIILSIFGFTIDEFKEIAEKIDKSDADLVEINISCPNVQDEHGKPFACLPGAPKEVIKIVKENTKKPIIVKLSPNVTDIVSVAREVEEAGADAISAINTLGPGMVINVDIMKPVLSANVGGISGPAIRPLAVKMIYDIFKNVKIPIIGMGGVSNGRDVLEMMMAGARLVAIGSGVYFKGIDVYKKSADWILDWMEKNKIDDINEIIGIAHK